MVEIGSGGLGRHVNQDVVLDQESDSGRVETNGTLVYAVRDTEGNLTPVDSGDRIRVRHAYPLGSRDRAERGYHLKEYKVRL